MRGSVQWVRFFFSELRIYYEIPKTQQSPIFCSMQNKLFIKFLKNAKQPSFFLILYSIFKVYVMKNLKSKICKNNFTLSPPMYDFSWTKRVFVWTKIYLRKFLINDIVAVNFRVVCVAIACESNQTKRSINIWLKFLFLSIIYFFFTFWKILSEDFDIMTVWLGQEKMPCVAFQLHE